MGFCNAHQREEVDTLSEGRVLSQSRSSSKISGSEGERVQPITFEEVLVMLRSCDLAWTDKFPYKDAMPYLITLPMVAR